MKIFQYSFQKREFINRCMVIGAITVICIAFAISTKVQQTKIITQETVQIVSDKRIELLIASNEALIRRMEDIEASNSNTRVCVEEWNQMYNNWFNRRYK